MNIKLNNEVSIDLRKLIESRLLVQANSGGGKTHTIKRILEQSHGKVQQIILDSEGEFGTLREKYDYVLAGKGGDTPAEPRSAALLARKLLELNVSAIIDLYELHPQERKRFVKLFCESLVNAPKELWHDCIVVIDEAHTYAPEKGQSEAMDAVIGLCALGRKRGFCAVLATQRISKLHKDAAAECNNKLIGRASQDIDMKRAADELGFTSREQMLSLRALKPGEFYAFGPAISDEVQKLKVGDIQTSHTKAGSRSLTKVYPPTDGIKKILGKLADLPAEAEEEARTIADFKQKNSELKRENDILRKTPGSQDPQVIQGIVNKEVEKAVREAEHRIDKEFQEERQAWDRYNKEWQTILDKWVRYAKQLMQVVSSISRITGELAKIKEPDTMLPDTEKPKPSVTGKAPMKVVAIQLPKAPMERLPAVQVEGDFTPSNSQRKILNSLAWLEAIGRQSADKNQLAFLSDQSPKSSGYSNNLGALRTAGMISYPQPGAVSLTDGGRALAEAPEQPATTEELHRQIQAKASNSQWKILQALIDVYPESLPKTELAERAGQSSISSGYSNNLGNLRTLGLIDYPTPGMVVALPTLFLS